MNNLINVGNLDRNHRRRIFAVFAVASGSYVACKMVQHVRTEEHARARTSAPSSSLWWSGLMPLLYRTLRPADESRPVPLRSRYTLRSPVPTDGESQPLGRRSALGESPAVAALGSRTSSQTLQANLGEHSQWLESFRTEQSRRLKSVPPAD
jgi:hypothetical protein